MANYSEEQREQHKGMVKRAIALDPNLSLIKLQKALEEREGTTFSIDYIRDMIKVVRQEWVDQYDHETKDLVSAKFDELGMFIIENLRNILKEEKIIYNKTASIDQAVVSQANRIKALKEIRDTARMMIDMKMDLGILERHIGRIDGEADVIRVRNIASDLIAYRKQKNEPVGINSSGS